MGRHKIPTTGIPAVEGHATAGTGDNNKRATMYAESGRDIELGASPPALDAILELDDLRMLNNQSE